MAFEPRNELERLFLAASQDPSSLPAFNKGLLDHDLYIVLAGEEPPTENGIVTTPTSIQTPSLKFENRFVVPMFTSLERLAAFAPKPDIAYVAMNGRAMLTTFQGKEFLLNPGADVSKLITPSEASSILNVSAVRMQSETIPAGATVRMWEPKHRPTHITEALTHFFESRKDVDAAYVVVMQIPETSPDCWFTIGLEMSGNADAIGRDAAPILNSVLRSEDRVQFMALSNSPGDVVSRHCKAKVKPFYKRKKKWLGLF